MEALTPEVLDQAIARAYASHQFSRSIGLSGYGGEEAPPDGRKGVALIQVETGEFDAEGNPVVKWVLPQLVHPGNVAAASFWYAKVKKLWG